MWNPASIDVKISSLNEKKHIYLIIASADTLYILVTVNDDFIRILQNLKDFIKITPLTRSCVLKHQVDTNPTNYNIGCRHSDQTYINTIKIITIWHVHKSNM